MPSPLLRSKFKKNGLLKLVEIIYEVWLNFPLVPIYAIKRSYKRYSKVLNSFLWLLLRNTMVSMAKFEPKRVKNGFRLFVFFCLTRGWGILLCPALLTWEY